MSNIVLEQSLQEQTLLIIEDDLDTLELLQEVFIDYFKDVLIAQDGYLGLDILESHNVDVVFCDIKMPKISGLDTIKKIRENNYLIPIIILSAYSDANVLFEASNLNIQGYVLKPINIEEIKIILNKLNRYQNNITTKLYQIDDELFFDSPNSKLIFSDEEVLLTQKEREFLQLLIDKKAQVVPYDIIEKVLWFDNNESMSQSSLRTLVKNVRKKLKQDNIIQNISKLGYKIL